MINTTEIIIRNAVMTPDGTYLRSYHRHDYVSYTDQITNEVYIVDGGNDYIRRSVNVVPAEDLTVYLSAKFELVRNAFVWKSYGKNNEHSPDGIYIALLDMESNHLCAILDTQNQIMGTYVEELMIKELAYRRENYE